MKEQKSVMEQLQEASRLQFENIANKIYIMPNKKAKNVSFFPHYAFSLRYYLYRICVF